MKEHNKLVGKDGKIGAFNRKSCPMKKNNSYIQYSWTREQTDGLFYEVYYIATDGRPEIEIDPIADARC